MEDRTSDSTKRGLWGQEPEIQSKLGNFYPKFTKRMILYPQFFCSVILHPQFLIEGNDWFGFAPTHFYS